SASLSWLKRTFLFVPKPRPTHSIPPEDGLFSPVHLFANPSTYGIINAGGQVVAAVSRTVSPPFAVMSNRQRVYRTHAIVLRRRDFQDADRILTIYTPNYGKLEVIAKGIRKTTSR